MKRIPLLFPTKVHCIHLVSMNLANMSPLQMCPLLDAVSLREWAKSEMVPSRLLDHLTRNDPYDSSLLFSLPNFFMVVHLLAGFLKAPLFERVLSISECSDKLFKWLSIVVAWCSSRVHNQVKWTTFIIISQLDTHNSAIQTSIIYEIKYTMYMKNLHLRADLFMWASAASIYGPSLFVYWCIGVLK